MDQRRKDRQTTFEVVRSAAESLFGALPEQDYADLPTPIRSDSPIDADLPTPTGSDSPIDVDLPTPIGSDSPIDADLPTRTTSLNANGAESSTEPDLCKYTPYRDSLIVFISK